MKGIRPTLCGWILGVAVLLISGCDTSPQNSHETPTQQKTNGSSAQQKIDSTELWSSAAAAIQQSQQTAKALQTATEQLLATPSSDTLAAAQSAWADATLAYAQFYFFSELSVIDPEGFQLIHEHHFRVAGNPVQPGYLDTFGPYQFSGLVHDISIELAPKNLLNQHGLTDLGDICLGLYAIEYMLFGENKNRQHTDYQLPLALTQAQIETGFQTVEETPAFRRRELLHVQTLLLSQELTSLYPLVAPQGVIDSTVWQGNSQQANATTLRTTLERALTQLLVEVIKRQKAIASPEISGEYHHGYALTSEQSAQQLANKLGSIASAQSFINSPELFTELSLAQSEIAAFVADPLSPPPWQTVYSHLKTAIEHLKTPPPNL